MTEPQPNSKTEAETDGAAHKAAAGGPIPPDEPVGPPRPLFATPGGSGSTAETPARPAATPGAGSGEAADGPAEDRQGGFRLDRVGDIARAAGAAELRRHTFTPADDDGEDETSFGPTLAAWLETYRARQAASGDASSVQAVRLNPPPTSEVAARAAERMKQPERTAHPEWGGKAQGALSDMLATMTSAPPPEWIATRRSAAPVRGSGPGWVLAGAIILVMGATATVAFIAAARNAGVETSLSNFLGAVAGADSGGADPARSVPAASVVVAAAGNGDATDAGQVSAADGPPYDGTAQGGPTIAIVPTRIVPASIGLPQSAPTLRRTTMVLPTAPIIEDAALSDHPIASASPTGSTWNDAVASASIAAEQAGIDMAAATVEPPLPAEVEIASAAGFVPQPEPIETDPGLPDVDTEALIARANRMLSIGDVVAARMLYEMAARGGSPDAAVGAGHTYDPVHYERLGVRGIEPDAAMAIAWYNTAVGVGDKSALDDIDQLNRWVGQ